MSPLSPSMRVVVAARPGGPEVLGVVGRPKPEPGPNEVRLRVAAAGVNRPDVLERQGLYPPPAGAPEGLGLEVSGVIDAIGTGVERWAIGDRVCALVSGGGYADTAIAKAGACLPVPAGVDLEAAAGLPETVFTVWANVFDRGRLAPGETLLVHGGASGIGVMAIQMAAAHGARVIATCGTAEKAALCERRGAIRAINYREADFVTAVKDLGGADVVLDMVGGAYVARNLDVLKMDGRLVQIAFLEGFAVEIDLRRIMMKRLTLTGSTLRARPDADKAALAAAVEAHAWPWIASGRVRPVIDSVFALDEASAAHARMDSGAHAGKILLKP